MNHSRTTFNKLWSKS